MREHFDVPPVPVLVVVFEGVECVQNGKRVFLLTDSLVTLASNDLAAVVTPAAAQAVLPGALRELADNIESGEGVLG